MSLVEGVSQEVVEENGRQEPILLICQRYHLQATLERMFELRNASHVYEQDGMVIREFVYKSLQRLCIVSGVQQTSERDTIANIRQIASCDEFTGCKVVFVCQNSVKRHMIEVARVVFPQEWDVCITVDELQTALGENFSEEQKRHIEQRHLPRPLPTVNRRRMRPGEHVRARIRRQQEPEAMDITRFMMDVMNAPQQQQGGNRTTVMGGGIQGGSAPMIRIRRRRRGPALAVQGHELGQLLFNEIARDPEGFEQAARLSMETYQQELYGRPNQPSIREQQRNERPWDKVFKDVVPVTEQNVPQDHICCVCTENYATIKTMDEAGACDHLVMCDGCARIIMDTTKKCPMCRAKPMTVRRETLYIPTENTKEVQEAEPPTKRAKK